jgi:protein-tyrosine phosphatase
MRRPVVLAVCLGNICRSPTAEAALREAAKEVGLDLDIRSAGTGGWHIGHPPDDRMREAAATLGLTLAGTADQVDAAALQAADLVLAMDRSNLADLERLARISGITADIRLFRAFDPQANGELEVPDPFYGGADGFTEVVIMVRRTSRRIVELIAAGALPKPGE